MPIPRLRRDFLGIVRARDLNPIIDALNALESSSEAAATGSGFDLPTDDPQVAGALWNDNGTVKVSAGS